VAEKNIEVVESIDQEKIRAGPGRLWCSAGSVDCTSVSQPPGRGPVPGPGINYTGPQEVLLEIVILVF